MKHSLKAFYLFLFAMSLLASCNKYAQTKNDLRGNNYISGIVYLENDYSTNGLLTPLINHFVQIKDTTELSSPDYLYAVKTDSNGYFIFQNLRNAVSYTVFATDTLSGVSYYGNLIVVLSNDTAPKNNAVLVLTPDSAQQNGFIYTVMDSAHDIIANCQVCVFSSPLLFNQDSCSGAIFNLKTNSFGLASQFSISPGTYMTQATAIFGKDTLRGQDSSLIIPFIGTKKDTIIVGRH